MGLDETDSYTDGIAGNVKVVTQGPHGLYPVPSYPVRLVKPSCLVWRTINAREGGTPDYSLKQSAKSMVVRSQPDPKSLKAW